MQKETMKECTSRNEVNVTLKVIGGKWKPLVLWLLCGRTLRFSELMRELPGVTKKMLTQQLRELEHDRLISRKVYAQVPPKVEYEMTEYGMTLTPVLAAMSKWGTEHSRASKAADTLLSK